jgi:hypothetical protein
MARSGDRGPTAGKSGRRHDECVMPKDHGEMPGGEEVVFGREGSTCPRSMACSQGAPQTRRPGRLKGEKRASLQFRSVRQARAREDVRPQTADESGPQPRRLLRTRRRESQLRGHYTENPTPDWSLEGTTDAGRPQLRGQDLKNVLGSLRRGYTWGAGNAQSSRTEDDGCYGGFG